MNVKNKGDRPTLDAAYDLSTPDDSRNLYRGWADSYDATFIDAKAYAYPQRIAALFAAEGGTGPVLDVGCGTGAVAEALTTGPIDGIDISPEMLDQAAAKNLYRSLIEADLTTSPLPRGAYNGVVSAGTFTHGHVGPEVLIPLSDTARSGGLFVIGVNAEVFANLPFQSVLDGLQARGQITSPKIVEGRIYHDDAAHEHADDLFQALIFRKT